MSEKNKNKKSIDKWGELLANMFPSVDEAEDFKNFVATSHQVKKLTRKQKLELLNIIASEDDIYIEDMLDAITISVQAKKIMKDFENKLKEMD